MVRARAARAAYRLSTVNSISTELVAYLLFPLLVLGVLASGFATS